VGAAAQLLGELADRHDPDDLAVLVAEVGDRTGRAGVVERHHLGGHVRVVQDAVVDGPTRSRWS
jgi:hypothetical protein